jgi:hypothetical protein
VLHASGNHDELPYAEFDRSVAELHPKIALA